MDYVVLLYIGTFAFFGSLIVGIIFDGTVRRKPSDWLGYSYLAFLAMSLGYASKWLDDVMSHPYLSLTIGLGSVAGIGWLTVLLWRKAAKWDQNFEKRRRD